MADQLTSKQMLERMQEIVYGMLCDIDDFCRENHITYFLSGGTCLGAVRHHGFIPWDDDGDIMMPRREYNRFMELFPQRFKGRYGVGALSLDPKWNRQWGKVWDLNTTLRYTNFDNRDIGVFVDVYPIDGLPRTARGKKLFYLAQRTLFSIARDCMRNDFLPDLRFMPLRRIVRFFSRKIGPRFFVEGIDRIARHFDFDTSEQVACSVPVHYGARETIRRELMAQAVPMPFRDRMLPVPVGYDTYLSNLYGDYMRIPKDAEEKGYTHLGTWEVQFDVRREPESK